MELLEKVKQCVPRGLGVGGGLTEMGTRQNFQGDENVLKLDCSGTSLVVQGLRLCAPSLGQSLVKELDPTSCN